MMIIENRLTKCNIAIENIFVQQHIQENTFNRLGGEFGTFRRRKMNITYTTKNVKYIIARMFIM